MARIITEKQTSRLPANANSSGLSKGIDMKMYEIEVYRANGGIGLLQSQEGYSDQTIVIAPEQAETLCKWIMSMVAIPSSKKEK